MFRRSQLAWVALSVFLSIAFAADSTSEPFSELCPCLPRSICPRVYGMSAEDAFYLGTILKCAEDDHVRCCGVSINKVIASTSSGSSTIISSETGSTEPDLRKKSDGEQMAAETTTIDFFDDDDKQTTTISNEVDIDVNPIEAFHLAEEERSKILTTSESPVETTTVDLQQTGSSDVETTTTLPEKEDSTVHEIKVEGRNVISNEDLDLINTTTTSDSEGLQNPTEANFVDQSTENTSTPSEVTQNVANIVETSSVSVPVPVPAEEISTQAIVVDAVSPTESATNGILQTITEKIVSESIKSEVKTSLETVNGFGNRPSYRRYSNNRRRHSEWNHSPKPQILNNVSPLNPFKPKFREIPSTVRPVEVPVMQLGVASTEFIPIEKSIKSPPIHSYPNRQYNYQNKRNTIQNLNNQEMSMRTQIPIMNEHEKTIVGVHGFLSNVMKNNNATTNSKFLSKLMHDKSQTKQLNGLEKTVIEKMSEVMQSNHRLFMRAKSKFQSQTNLKNQQTPEVSTKPDPNVNESFETTTQSQTAFKRPNYERRRLPARRFTTKVPEMSLVTLPSNSPKEVSNARNRYIRRKTNFMRSSSNDTSATSNNERMVKKTLQNVTKMEIEQPVMSRRRMLFSSRRRVLPPGNNFAKTINSTTTQASIDTTTVPNITNDENITKGFETPIKHSTENIKFPPQQHRFELTAPNDKLNNQKSISLDGISKFETVDDNKQSSE